MRKFAALFEHIDQVQSTNEKVEHIKNYFDSCSDEDGAWALFFLCGHRIKRLISSRMLLDWSMELINYPPWLIAESYAAVGDTVETIALLLPRKDDNQEIRNEHSLSEWMESIIKPLQKESLEEKRSRIISFWKELSTKEIFIINKLLTGSFRMGVSSLLTLKALSQSFDVSREILSQRLMGNWEPSGQFFKELRSSETNKRYLTPYPFYLAYPFEGDLQSLGDFSDWQIEWKWDGIRGQAVIGEDGAALWSRGNELISDQFPELIEAFKTVAPGTILDGEVLAYAENRPLPFAELQKRLGRKTVSKAMIEKVPIVFVVYDILEYQGNDLRNKPMHERRSILESITFTSPRIIYSELIDGSEWQHILDLRLQSRERGVEGLMLKKMDSIYGVGRQKGYWWKYKIDPMTIDAVLIYAQAGTGRRANLFTDYTFGVWKDQELIPIAKAYSGLDQKEIDELDRWIRKNTEEKFGPVRKVKAFQVFEIAFEGIQKSKRHKSEVALRFPRIIRWRKDKPLEECDTLESIKKTFLNEE
ncbi:MAG TPA: ATP-dependent DNA ligase [Parachlamydiaceae bacterium]|nr:ATP-dependent DNA ligase [Parachlamydiaceae bacterium]